MDVVLLSRLQFALVFPHNSWHNGRMFADRKPKIPTRLHSLAREILDELRGQPAAAAIILGGGVALQHYCEYRDTHDIDAWWRANPTDDTKQLLKEIMQRVASRHGYALHVRTWGETESLELQEDGKTVFSFQVAVRSVELEPPGPSAWPPVQIETLLDNLGAKMNALVNRGSPRDFLDIFTVVEKGLATIDELWAAWARKNPGSELASAKVQLLRRLEELEARRPLSILTDKEYRDSAAAVRAWTRNELCREELE